MHGATIKKFFSVVLFIVVKSFAKYTVTFIFPPRNKNAFQLMRECNSQAAKTSKNILYRREKKLKQK
jgi:hypothetical protein